ncbi:MAG: pyruvate carboxyltransferase, partial [Chloroflexi bacterium]|nr:pyruvate carboxyltransferase [Chloroflexota bacterium]
MAQQSGGTPWRTDKWFTSPWNFIPEVTADYTFPAQLIVHDVTLRDGEQQAGVEFTKDDKVRIAEALAEAGVHRIEAGMPAVSASDTEAIKEIVRRNLPADIVAFSRCMVEDVKRAIDCGVKRIVMEIPSSKHLTEEAYLWPMEKAIELSIEATKFAHEQGLYVSYFPIDASRADITTYMDMVDYIAQNGWMDSIGVVDTFG